MPQSTVDTAQTYKIRVWDLPLRIFHWALAVAVASAVACAEIPGIPVEWHARSGYMVLALLVFRLAWGLVGGHWSRFARLRPTPARLRAYFKGKGSADDQVGHSPLGALATIALLTILALQVGSGLLADDEIAFVGPLNHLVSTAVGEAATEWHKELGKLLVFALVGLHVVAVVYYLRVRKHNLLGPMVHGDKLLAHPARGSRDDGLVRLWGLFLAVLAAGVVGWLVLQGG
jgi:cytochrome b